MTVVTGISNGTEQIDSAQPGGLVGLSTEVDPSFAKADSLVGDLVGHVGKLPESTTSITIKYHGIERNDVPMQKIKENEPLLMGIGTATVIGHAKRVKKDTVELELRKPVCAEKNVKIAVLRNISQRWRLTGYGVIS